MSTFLTVAIPYVNAEPHVGYAYELVEADLVARGRRECGESVRFLGGTDDHSLKNVLAAASAGEPTGDFVDRRGDRFVELADRLVITFDDFVRTSSDPRHRPAVERLWRACDANGDLERRDYEGRYCVGCEQFFEPGDLDEGLCPEHRRPLESVAEPNWFFRLSRYQDRLADLIERSELEIEPAGFRAEVLGLLRGGLHDISVSRSVERARGWGVPVPGDPSQVVAVWFDALTNYISSLGFGDDGPDYDTWWRRSDHRIHVVGKGITRFHAVYWPAFLLSAGEPLPTRIHVHPYLTADGEKLSKSAGATDSPFEIIDRFGADALRWWIAREVAAGADTAFTVGRLVGCANADLANGVGNAVSRVVALGQRCEIDLPPPDERSPLDLAADLPASVAQALADFDRQCAASEISRAIDRLNRHIEETAPWQLAREPSRRTELADLLAVYAATLRTIGAAIRPIAPDVAARVDTQLLPGAVRRSVHQRLEV